MTQRVKARLVLAALLAIAGSTLTPATAATTTVVAMKEFAFAPAHVTIAVGDTVEWQYQESADDPAPNCESPYFQLPDPVPVRCPGHSTTSSDAEGGHPLWDSGVHRADGFPFRFTFTKAGTYHYICTVHGGAAKNNPLTNMEGDVVVEAAPAHVLGEHKALPSTGIDVAVLLAFALVLGAAGSWVRRALRPD
ncbi:MAG: plastocyanin/azurin family copper-binding protein [Actinomycetota bacterium]|nr:hypothetical protein [Actinomycetota bacterium]